MQTIQTDAVVKFDTTEMVIQQTEKLLDLKIDGPAERKVAGSHRVKVNALINTVERRRIDLKKDIDTEGKAITARLEKVKIHLSNEIEKFDQVEIAARAEKLAVEKIRTDAILAEITAMKNITSAAQAYGLSSEQIFEYLTRLEQFPVEKTFFQEFFDNTIEAKGKQLEIVQSCYDRVLKWEADQKAQAEAEAANKAEAERIEKIAKDFFDKVISAKEEADKAEAEAQAKLAEERAKIDAEHKAFEDEKAMAAAEIQAEKDKIARAEAEKAEKIAAAAKYSLDWDKAHEFNHMIALGESRAEAITLSWIDEAYRINDQVNLGQAMADDIKKARLEALKPDKDKLLKFAEKLSLIEFPALKTAEGKSISSIAAKKICACVDGIIAGVESLQ